MNDLASQSDSDVVINNVNISNMGEPGLYYFDETDGIAAFSSISSDIKSQIMCCDAIHINELTEDVAHGRSGHAHDRALHIMKSKSMLDGMENVPVSTKRRKTRCSDDGCPLGKMTSRSVQQDANRMPSGPGSDLATDIGGPIPVTALGGFRYFCLVKDLYTMCRFIFFMKKKDEWKRLFFLLLADIKVKEKELKCVVYNLELLIHDHDIIFLQQEVQTLRATTIPFRQWTSAPYVHCHSIEGDMRIICRMAVGLLASAGLPFFLWRFVFMCVVYQLNRQYTSVYYNPTHKYMVPWERRFGERTDFRNMIKLGSKVYVFIDKKSRDALSAHAWIGFFVGYAENCKGYFIYDPSRLNVYICFFILVDETIMYGDIMGAKHAKKLKVYKSSLQLHNDGCKQLHDCTDKDSVLYQSILPEMFHPIHHAPLLNQSDVNRNVSTEAINATNPLVENRPITTLSRETTNTSTSTPTTDSIMSRRAQAEAVSVQEELLRTAAKAIRPDSDSQSEISPQVQVLAERERGETSTIGSRLRARKDVEESMPNLNVNVNERQVDSTSSAVDLNSSVNVANIDESSNHLDSTPNGLNHGEIDRTTDESYEIEQVEESHGDVPVDSTVNVPTCSLQNGQNGAFSSIASVVSNPLAFFLRAREPQEEDQGRTARDYASSWFRCPSLHARSGVVSNFLRLICCISIACDDIFAPKTSLEHELEALVFNTMRTQEGTIISKIGYRDPRGWNDMMRRGEPEKSLFQRACLEEVHYGFNNSVYRVIHRDAYDGIPVGSLWVLHMKFKPDNTIDKARGRLTIRGDQTIEGLHYNEHEIHAPVSIKSSLFIVLSICVQYSLYLTRIDITKAFNSGELGNISIAMEVPDGFKDHPEYAPHGRNTLWEVLVATYGLKQAASAYYRKFSDGMIERGYKRLGSDGCVFVKGTLGTKRYICFPIHVDDKICAYASDLDLKQFKQDLDEIGLKWNEEGADVILGMVCEYDRLNQKIALSHKGLIELVVQESGLSKANPKGVPCTPDSCKKLVESQNSVENIFDKDRYKKFRHILGVISHICNYTHPELMWSVSLLSAYMSCPSAYAMIFLLDIVLYLKGVQEDKFYFSAMDLENGDEWAFMMSDASLGNRSKKRSQICFLAFLFGNLVGWKSRFHPSVCLSVAESEFMALAAAGQYGCWFTRVVNELGVQKLGPMHIYSDSKAAISIAQNPLYTKFTKHIDMRFEWLKSAVLNLILKPFYTTGKSNYSDIGTKPLFKQHFQSFYKAITGNAKLHIVNPNKCTDFQSHVETIVGNSVRQRVSLNAISFAVNDFTGFIHSSFYQPNN